MLMYSRELPPTRRDVRQHIPNGNQNQIESNRNMDIPNLLNKRCQFYLPIIFLHVYAFNGSNHDVRFLNIINETSNKW